MVPLQIPLIEGVVATLNKLSKQPTSKSKNTVHINDNGLIY